jgi:hypothetical protein
MSSSMTRELIKSEIDKLPDNAFNAFQAIFAAFFGYVSQVDSYDNFWSDKNQAYLSKSISDYENGTSDPVVKTMEELESYEY